MESNNMLEEDIEKWEKKDMKEAFNTLRFFYIPLDCKL